LFRFVAVWNEAESQDCNDIEDLEKCHTPLLGLEDIELIDVDLRKEEMERRCR
jgi:hypothetical protein